MTKIIDDLLDEIHKSILAGRFHDLPGLALTLDAEIPSFVAGNAKVIDRIRSKTERNQKCLMAAMQGFGAAKMRLEDIRRAANGLTTYGKNGSSALLASYVPPAKRV